MDVLLSRDRGGEAKGESMDSIQESYLFLMLRRDVKSFFMNELVMPNLLMSFI